MNALDCPPDWAMLQWHRDPQSKRYRTLGTATRACGWLNGHHGPHEVWLYRPGPVDSDGGVRLERRWIGLWDGVVE